MKKGDVSNIEETSNVLWYDTDVPLHTTPSTNQVFTLTTMIMEVDPHDETMPSTTKSTAEDEAFVGDFLHVSRASSNFVCACMYYTVRESTRSVRYIYVGLSFIFF